MNVWQLSLEADSYWCSYTPLQSFKVGCTAAWCHAWLKVWRIQHSVPCARRQRLDMVTLTATTSEELVLVSVLVVIWGFSLHSGLLMGFGEHGIASFGIVAQQDSCILQLCSVQFGSCCVSLGRPSSCCYLINSAKPLLRVVYIITPVGVSTKRGRTKHWWW